MGASDTPVKPPCYFLLRTKIIFSIKCIVFSKNKNNMGVSCAPPPPPSWGVSEGIRRHQGASDTTHPSSTTHNNPHQHATHPTTTTTPPPPPNQPHPLNSSLLSTLYCISILVLPFTPDDIDVKNPL